MTTVIKRTRTEITSNNHRLTHRTSHMSDEDMSITRVTPSIRNERSILENIITPETNHLQMQPWIFQKVITYFIQIACIRNKQLPAIKNSWWSGCYDKFEKTARRSINKASSTCLVNSFSSTSAYFTWLFPGPETVIILPHLPRKPRIILIEALNISM